MTTSLLLCSLCDCPYETSTVLHPVMSAPLLPAWCNKYRTSYGHWNNWETEWDNPIGSWICSSSESKGKIPQTTFIILWTILKFLLSSQTFWHPHGHQCLYTHMLINYKSIAFSWCLWCFSNFLAEICESAKIGAWTWSAISGVNTVEGLPELTAYSVSKSPCWKCALHLHLSLSVCSRHSWISYGVFLLRELQDGLEFHIFHSQVSVICLKKKKTK